MAENGSREQATSLDELRAKREESGGGPASVSRLKVARPTARFCVGHGDRAGGADDRAAQERSIPDSD
ncbi:Hypp174 [Branchiostoma lanceolatum]|uniref:Hypp174 protein n=1 Tax=Branchiostoma lanceolatum TaxID=7740 RepID=A0A8J9V861_BRALA|nr:Hypp174 [Branchiostoma lanceolatum]